MFLADNVTYVCDVSLICSNHTSSFTTTCDKLQLQQILLVFFLTVKVPQMSLLFFSKGRKSLEVGKLLKMLYIYTKNLDSRADVFDFHVSKSPAVENDR